MPETGTVHGPYTNQRTRLLKDFDKITRKLGRRVLESHYSGELVDTVLKESRREYEALIPLIPDIGGKKNISQTNLINSAQCLALYRALKSHGKTAEEAGRLIYEFVEAQLTSVPRWILLLLGRWRFTKYSLNKVKKHAVESQKRRYPEDWVFTFIEGDGKEFDFGRDYTECAICKFFHAQGADELVPYLCRTEFAVSRAFGMGLVRTMTIAEGGKKCDPRFKRGRETKLG
jgi:hypothetical protein